MKAEDASQGPASTAGGRVHDRAALLDIILDSATDYAIFILDAENRITTWNVGAAKVLGWTAEEAIGMNGAAIFTPEDREAGEPHKERRKARAEGRAEDRRWHLRKDGGRLWCNGLLMPLRDGSGGYLKILRDQTREHFSDRALRDSEARFRTLAENIPQLVFLSRNTGDRTWGSPQWEDYAGLSDLDSRGAGWMDALHPDDHDITSQAWREAQDNGRYYVEHRFRSQADGGYRWFQTRAKPLGEPHDRDAEWVGTSTDVHDLRTLQERQKVLLAELQHRTRNLLAVVSSVAQQTMASSGSLEDFDHRYSSRLAALGRVQGFLSRPAGSRIDFREIVQAELAAHGTEAGERVVLAGPPVELPINAVQTLALAVHELSTNALKYGALRAPAGRLAVTWRLSEDGAADGLFELDWEETGVGVTEPQPSRRGYGRRLIERGLPYDLGAQTRLQFGPDGIRCHIALPLHRGTP